jgi:peptidoglycan/LPS O-acetylase OafA/YrhL
MSGSERAKKSTRLHYIDWLRLVATVGVFVYHAARPFVLQDWLIMNEHQSLAVTFIFLVFLGSWGMPLFFLMAGAGSQFALRRRSARQFVIERVKRLLIPFIIGCILLSPVQFYMEWLHKGWYSGSFFGFLPEFLQSLDLSLPGILSPTTFEEWGSHLWFLGYLITFSFVALPAFLWFKTDAGKRTVRRLGSLAERRGGLLAFVMPLALVRLSLQARYSDYADWADFSYMLVYFILGYVLYADVRFARAIRRDAWLNLALGIGTIVAMVVAGIAGVVEEWATTPGTVQFYFAWGVVVLSGWCWTSFALYIGMRFFDTRNKWLEYGQDAILPFYLFHQPVIVTIAFYTVGWDIAARLGASVDISVKLPIVMLGSFAATLGVYEAFIRRVQPARSLLGMKPRRDVRSQVRASP